MTISRAIKDYLRHCQVVKNYTANTLRNYRHYLKRFEIWATENKLSHIADVTIDDIEEFAASLHHSAGTVVQAQSRNYYLIVLRNLLRFLATRDEPALSPEKIMLAKTPGRQVEFLEAVELTQLRDGISNISLANRRDRAM